MATDNDEAKAQALRETRDYIWKYWVCHADQRLRTFHFFILLVTVFLAGILTYLKDARYPIWFIRLCSG